MSIYEVRENTPSPKSNVRDIMEHQGVSFAKLAERTKLSTKIIERARGENIKKCKLETLAIIAQGLDVKIKDLFDEE
jgi:DNA-binding Xre family transcriptional regulator